MNDLMELLKLEKEEDVLPKVKQMVEVGSMQSFILNNMSVMSIVYSPAGLVFAGSTNSTLSNPVELEQLEGILVELSTALRKRRVNILAQQPAEKKG